MSSSLGRLMKKTHFEDEGSSSGSALAAHDRWVKDAQHYAPPFEELVKVVPDAIPEELASRVAMGLEALRSGDMMLFGSQRDKVWSDIIDPELCLTRSEGEWQTADVEVAAEGQTVRWLSWVNHLEGDEHAGVLASLAELFQLALPKLDELASVHRGGAPTSPLSGTRRLQLVVGAFEHALEPPPPTTESGGGTLDGSPQLYKISDWHVDGSDAERIVATATCYIDVGDGLEGGAIEYQHRRELWLDDPTKGTHKVLPSSRMLVAFDNASLRHRVLTVRGTGRRLLVVFHLVDPQNPTAPRASELPRQLKSQRIREASRAFAEALSARTDLKAVGIQLPPELIEHICAIAAKLEGALTHEELLERRDEQRRRRLVPKRGLRRATGTYTFYDDPAYAMGTGVSPDDDTDDD
jgi:hypothetical protein